ncbi:hypothetical protein YC2023_114225 [Brassica napus]
MCVTGNARVPSDSAHVELDSTFNLLDYIFPDISANMNEEHEEGSSGQPMDTDRPSASSGNSKKGDGFDEMFADYNQELYPGCDKFTRYHTIPDSIGNLKHLASLTLAISNFSGRIPSSLGELSNLSRLSLYRNHFTGEVPSLIGNLKQLISFDVGYNQLIGSFPSALLNLTKLRFISLCYNQFTGFLPPNIGQLSKLEVLSAYGCNITEFPEFIKDQRNLHSLDLSKNNIKGQVPDWLWRVQELQVLDLSHNSLSGFDGSLKDVPGNHMEILDLRSNAFQGRIFIPYTCIVCLFASSNNLTGEIPRSLCGGHTSPTIIDLSNNNFHGSIPQCLGSHMSSLVDLNLRNNSLSGSLPDMFMHAYELSSIDVSHNRLVGKLPASLTACSSLEVLNVESNEINDTFPFQLNSLQKLQVLVLRSNKFHGMLHHSDGVCPNYIGDSEDYRYYISVVFMNKGVSMVMDRILTVYTAIDFSGNRIHGEIPESIGLLKELHVLNLSSNAFTGHIPSSLANITALESLDISQNKLSGSIPQGTQFQRQTCSSYEGNPGLFGPSLEDICREPTSTESESPVSSKEKEEKEESFCWVAAGLGFAPGVVFGFTIGYIVVSYKHEWFIKTFGRNKKRGTR